MLQQQQENTKTQEKQKQKPLVDRQKIDAALETLKQEITNVDANNGLSLVKVQKRIEEINTKVFNTLGKPDFGNGDPSVERTLARVFFEHKIFYLVKGLGTTSGYNTLFTASEVQFYKEFDPQVISLTKITIPKQKIPIYLPGKELVSSREQSIFSGATGLTTYLGGKQGLCRVIVNPEKAKQDSAAFVRGLSGNVIQLTDKQQATYLEKFAIDAVLQTEANEAGHAIFYRKFPPDKIDYSQFVARIDQLWPLTITLIDPVAQDTIPAKDRNRYISVTHINEAFSDLCSLSVGKSFASSFPRLFLQDVPQYKLSGAYFVESIQQIGLESSAIVPNNHKFRFQAGPRREHYQEMTLLLLADLERDEKALPIGKNTYETELAKMMKHLETSFADSLNKLT